ncbi:MAG: hypothetical protein ABI867_43665 [Kofleriaceae bacterium]
MRRVVLLAVFAASCRGGGKPERRHDHAPVDARFDYAVTAPSNMKAVTINSVRVERRRAGLGATGWEADLRATFPKYTVDPPRSDGDGFATRVHTTGHEFRAWYRSLGALGIQCVEELERDREIPHAVCYDTQLLADGFYVPFTLAHEAEVRVVLDGEIYSPTARLASAKPELDESTAISGRTLVDKGTLDDGWWVLATKRGNHDATTRRTIGGRDLACTVFTDRGEAVARRGLTTCFAIEAVGASASPRPPVDAAPLDAAMVLTGPANAEAMARAYVEALGRADEAGMRALLITPAINREFYRCDERRDYPVDDRVAESMARSMTPLETGRRWARDKASLELGAWNQTIYTPYASGATVTFVCHANRDLAIVAGTLDVTVVTGTQRKAMAVALVLVEAMGAARLASASLTER